jgi:hypothetical protein
MQRSTLIINMPFQNKIYNYSITVQCWVWIVGRNKVIECDSVVVDIAKAMGNGQLTRTACNVISSAHLL